MSGDGVATGQPAAWPPPATAGTVWRAQRVPGAEPVMVRAVRLWGRDVWADGTEPLPLVWCHACRRFRTVEELGEPWNSCPVGRTPPPNAVFRVEMAAEPPSPWHLGGF